MPIANLALFSSKKFQPALHINKWIVIIKFSYGYGQNVFCCAVIKMMLTQIMQPGCVKVPLEAKDKESAINELVNVLDSEKLLLNRQEALDAVLAREQTRSTGIGSGVAIPHGKCKAVKELVMAIGIAPRPIDFNSVDGKPVGIIILLISPSDQTGPHIQALAKISRMMLDEPFREKLQNAGSAEEVCELLTSRENE
jgi:fructose-specific phosphotransferase system IIA component